MNIRKLFARKVEMKEAMDDLSLWRPDAQLRIFAAHPDVHLRELMAADFREIFSGIDNYNDGCDPAARVRMEVHVELADALEGYIRGTVTRSQLGGLAYADGLRMHVGRTMYEAVYFNDFVYNTGLILYRPGAEKKAGKFLCGLSEPMDFGAFIQELQTPPVAATQPVAGWRKVLGL
jgi:hypothetical protein